MVALIICQCAFLSGQNFHITTQNRIDSFSYFHPDVTFAYRLEITGDQITNLHGLYQLQEVGRILAIYQTNIVDLEGLHNLQVLDIESDNQAVIHIADNPNLTSIEHIQDMQLPDRLGRLYIFDNPQLSSCNLPSVCTWIQNHHLVWISNNSDNCQNWHSVFADCSIPIDTHNREIIFEDSFEDWQEGKPVNWDVEVINTDDAPNYEKVPALSDGTSSILLRSNVPFFEGNLDTDLHYFINPDQSTIDLSFTYRCLGEGSCKIIIGQGFSGEQFRGPPFC